MSLTAGRLTLSTLFAVTLAQGASAQAVGTSAFLQALEGYRAGIAQADAACGSDGGATYRTCRDQVEALEAHAARVRDAERALPGDLSPAERSAMSRKRAALAAHARRIAAKPQQLRSSAAERFATDAARNLGAGIDAVNASNVFITAMDLGARHGRDLDAAFDRATRQYVLRGSQGLPRDALAAALRRLPNYGSAEQPWQAGITPAGELTLSNPFER